MTFADSPYDIYNGRTLDVKSLTKRERPQELGEIFAQARAWGKENWFVRDILKLQKDFLLYRMAVVTPDKADRRKVTRWLCERPVNEHGLNRQIQIKNLVHTAAAEWLLQRNVVFYWRDADPRPIILRPEVVKFSDVFGVERVRVVLGLTEKQLRDQGMSAEDARRYSDPKGVLLDPDLGDHWLVLRDGSEGFGLACPDLFSVFRTCSQSESMEVGESMYAYAGRRVEFTTSFGFEVKNAANAMKQEQFLWKKERATSVEKFYRGKQGYLETTRQFDQKTDIIWTKPEYYDARKWETITRRLAAWAGPLGAMLVGANTNINLLRLFRTQIEADRDRLCEYLEVVVQEAMQPPAPLKVRLSSQCFNDPRLAWDMVKTLSAAGPLSATTALTESDFDPDDEAERKESEAKTPEHYLPLYDANHGNHPGVEGRRGPKGGLSQREKPEE